MSEIRDTFFANKAIAALWDVAVSMKRGNPLPLDASAVFESYAALEAYIADKESVAYPGQIIAVVNADSTGIYYLDQELAIQEVGKVPSADNKSIEVADGVISMYNFGKYYYKYIPEVKNEETGEVTSAARYEKTEVSDTNVWAAGLEPKVVSENGELVIGWFEPNPTTIDGVQDQVTAVQGTVSDLDDQLNKEGGLVDQVEDLKEEIGHAATEAGNDATGLYAELDKKADKATTYTKDEVDSLLDDKANANNVYEKSETYTKEEVSVAIANAVSGADHLKRVILKAPTADQTVEDVINAWLAENNNAIAEQYIYMIPTGLSYDSNKYYEYIVITESDTSYAEQVGNWEVDLSDYISDDELANYLKDYYTSSKVDEILTAYAKTATIQDALKNYYTIEQLTEVLDGYYTDDEVDALLDKIYKKTEIDAKFNDYYNKESVNNLLDNKVDKEDGKSLVLNTEITKLETVKENAEPNFIKKVTSDFSVSDEGELSLNPLEISYITNLQETLNEKVDKVYYQVPVLDDDGNPTYDEDGTPIMKDVEGALLTPEDREKLNALVIGEEGVEISGTVNASNVEGLASWITSNRNTVPGLFSSVNATKLDGIEEGAQKNYISSVEETQFSVVEGKLSFSEVFANSISELTEASGLHTTKIANLENILNGYVDEDGNTINGLIVDVHNIQEALRWQNMVE